MAYMVAGLGAACHKVFDKKHLRTQPIGILLGRAQHGDVHGP
jgi:hypothetical protein